MTDDRREWRAPERIIFKLALVLLIFLAIGLVVSFAR